MFTKYVLPLVAVAGLSFAIFSVVQAGKPQPEAQKHMAPSTHPPQFDSEIAGAGLVEARMENIPIGSPTMGVVWEVFVKVGQKVKKGDPLFRIDDRAQQAELKVREASLAAAEAELHRLIAAPRKEDVPPAQAAVEEAQARLNDAEAAVGRTQRLFERQMISATDYDKDRFAYYAAKAALEKAKADLQKILAGTWKEDLDVSRAKVLQAKSQIEGIRIELDRLTVRALTDGEVLQVNVRPGQFAAVVWKEPMIVLGDVRQLNVRVDIDEHDLPLYRKEMEATAYLRGRPETPFRLKNIVKVEPYVIPKKSLTGDNSERVDTRVLQVVYALPEEEQPFRLYVGQQMDVYFGSRRPEKARVKSAEVGTKAASTAVLDGHAASSRQADTPAR
jgi:HlyD family secretion protein